MTVTLTAAGSERWMVSSLARTPSMTATVFSPIARRMSSITAGVLPSQTAPLGRSKLSSAYPMSDTRIGVPFLVATTISLKSAVASTRPSVRSSSWPLPCSTVPPGISTFSATTASRTCGDRQAVRVELLDVHDDVDLAGAPAGETHFADAVHGLDHAGDLLVGQLGERAQAHRVGGHDERHHRIRVRIDLGDDRREQRRRHAADGAGDLLADVVGRVVEVALEDEPDRDLAPAFRDPRLDFVDPGDAADGLFHRLDDRRRHLVRARARHGQGDADRRGIGFREQVHAESLERHRPEHHERHHEHRRKHRTADAELR